MISVGIVGGTGYTGAELLRLLAGHPEAEVTVITSRSEAGRRVDELFPALSRACNLSYVVPAADQLADCDLVFFATPHGVAMELMPELIGRGTRVVDLSADFRLQDIAVWEHWYAQPHSCPELLSAAVYGLPEMNRAAIKDAQLVAAAGCYPTAVQLGFWPLVKAGLVDTEHLIANAASGVSGAGRQAKVDNLMAEVNDSFKAYAVAGHRHLPEIEQGLSGVSGVPVAVTFVPHLLPIVRGIHATLYARLLDDGGSQEELRALYESHYKDEPFVEVQANGMWPQTRSVKGTNMCRISVDVPLQRGQVVVCSAIDNLAKGASGQAVQCMNIMLGLAENTGLDAIALSP